MEEVSMSSVVGSTGNSNIVASNDQKPPIETKEQNDPRYLKIFGYNVNKDHALVGGAVLALGVVVWLSSKENSGVMQNAVNTGRDVTQTATNYH